MLNLPRRVGETIRINEDITVTVLGIVGNHVRIRIEAPKVVPVVREKLLEREGNYQPVVE